MYQASPVYIKFLNLYDFSFRYQHKAAETTRATYKIHGTLDFLHILSLLCAFGMMVVISFALLFLYFIEFIMVLPLWRHFALSALIISFFVICSQSRSR